MIDSQWGRICGVHVQESGDLSAVWMAHDKLSDCIHLYDACIFQREVLAVYSEGLIARGRWIPIAWEKGSKDISDKLLDRGCNMLYEPSEETPELAEMVSRDIWERMRTHRFKVDKRLQNWQEEYKSFMREGEKVPLKTAPLMSATRHAVDQIQFAKRLASHKSSTKNHPQVAIK